MTRHAPPPPRSSPRNIPATSAEARTTRHALTHSPLTRALGTRYSICQRVPRHTHSLKARSPLTFAGRAVCLRIAPSACIASHMRHSCLKALASHLRGPLASCSALSVPACAPSACTPRMRPSCLQSKRSPLTVAARASISARLPSPALESSPRARNANHASSSQAHGTALGAAHHHKHIAH